MLQAVPVCSETISDFFNLNFFLRKLHKSFLNEPDVDSDFCLKTCAVFQSDPWIFRFLKNSNQKKNKKVDCN